MVMMVMTMMTMMMMIWHVRLNTFIISNRLGPTVDCPRVLWRLLALGCGAPAGWAGGCSPCWSPSHFRYLKNQEALKVGEGFQILWWFFAWIQMHWRCSVSHVRFSHVVWFRLTCDTCSLIRFCCMSPLWWSKCIWYITSRQFTICFFLAVAHNISQLFSWTLGGTRTCGPPFAKKAVFVDDEDPWDLFTAVAGCVSA